MAINNITRNNTIDEWRIQTNQSANALNTIETGDYTKSNGTLALTANSRLLITANGTSLQVSNTVLFESRLEVGNTIALGVREASTGNLTVGNSFQVYGKDFALFVANNALVNNNLQVTNTLNTGALNANNNVTVGRNLIMTNTGNVIFANTGSANIQTLYVTDGYARNVYADIVKVTNFIDVGANVKIGTYLNVGTFANIGANANIDTHVDIGTNANIGTYANVGSYLKVGSHIDVTTNAQIGTTLVVTGNTTVGNLNTSGVSNSQTLLVVGAGTIGTTLTVTGNTTVGNLNTSGVANSQTLLVAGAGTIGTTLTVTGNATVGNLNTAGVANSQTLLVVGAGTIGTSLSIGTTLAVTSNVTAGNLNTTNTVSAGTLVTTGSATIGGSLVAGATTLASGSVAGNFNVGGTFTLQGPTLIDTNIITLSANTPTFGSGFAFISINRGEGTTPANANAHIRWNETQKYWDIRDVDNSTSYSKILTANLISSDITSTSSGTFPSSAVANTINTRINNLNTSQIAESTTSNLWLTAARVRSNISSTTGSAGYNSSTGVITIPGTTSHITENLSGNIWLTAARVRSNISSTTGLAGYNSSTGVITIPGTTAHILESATSNIWLTAARVRANVSNTTPINYDSSTGVFSHAASGVSGTGYGDSVNIPTFVVNTTGHITSATNVAIRTATTLVTGIVQLTDSIVSTSTTTAATPNSVKTAYDLAATKFNSSGGTISGDVIVTGNLTISGNTTYANTQTLLIGDNIITLNADLPAGSAPSENSGIEVNRGNSTNVYIRWDEGIDSWVANNGFSGSEFRLPNTTTYLSEGTNLYLTSARVRSNVSNTAPINYDSSTGIFSHATSGVSASVYGDSINVATFVVNATGHVTSATNVALRAATTSVTGIVQLTDSISSTSTTTAATPNSVKTAYDLAAGKLSSVTITNGTGISGGGTGSSFTLSIGQAVATTSNVQFRTIGVGTTADTANTGSIRATGDITAFFSDERLKEDIVIIEDAINKVNSIRGVHYTPNDVAESYGYNKNRKVGVIAQDIEKVLPEIVVPAPFDTDENGISISGKNYKTVHYEKIVPLLIEAIKELSREVENLKKQIK